MSHHESCFFTHKSFPVDQPPQAGVRRVLKLWLLQLSVLKQSGQAERGHVLNSHALQEIAWNPSELIFKICSLSFIIFYLFKTKPSKFPQNSRIYFFSCFLGEHGAGLVLWQLPTLQRSQARGDFGHGERPCQLPIEGWNMEKRRKLDICGSLTLIFK